MATNTYIAIDKKTVTTPVATVEFTSIPQTYTDLILVFQGKCVDNLDASLTFRFNGDSASNYSQTFIDGNGTSATTFRESNQNQAVGAYVKNTECMAIAQIMNYSNSTTTKTMLLKGGSTGASIRVTANLWRKTPEAITSMLIGLNSATTFATGTTFSLYGIKAEPVSTAKATGGTITYDIANGYTYHTFISSGTFTPSVSLSCDILVVAGGGGGSSDMSGGGGAGGLLGFNSQSLTATGYTVTVGAGGAGTTTGGQLGTVGADSQFGALTLVKGGGRAGNYITTTGGTGGSGGGAGRGSGTQGGSASPSGQGNAGGNGSGVTYSGETGGGGGAGAVGGASSGSVSGSGGVGSSAYSSWGLVTSTGQNVSGIVYYAGGGGGGAESGTRGLGGNGGGAAGTNGSNAGSGTANTGGGGGGGGGGGNLGGAGGSGIVIVRYATV